MGTTYIPTDAFRESPHHDMEESPHHDRNTEGAIAITGNTVWRKGLSASHHRAYFYDPSGLGEQAAPLYKRTATQNVFYRHKITHINYFTGASYWIQLEQDKHNAGETITTGADGPEWTNPIADSGFWSILSDSENNITLKQVDTYLGTPVGESVRYFDKPFSLKELRDEAKILLDSRYAAWRASHGAQSQFVYWGAGVNTLLNGIGMLAGGPAGIYSTFGATPGSPRKFDDCLLVTNVVASQYQFVTTPIITGAVFYCTSKLKSYGEAMSGTDPEVDDIAMGTMPAAASVGASPGYEWEAYPYPFETHFHHIRTPWSDPKLV